MTAIITGERGDGALTRQGLEEYVSDCVILLDNRVVDQITTRRLRVVKYRGSAHGTNEYPFLVDDQGVSVLPVTSADLSYAASHEIVPTAIPGLDAMLEPGGFFKGSSVLFSGVAGTGKTTFSTFILDAACRRGERCLAFVFEESGEQVVRNAASVGLDLKRHVEARSATLSGGTPDPVRPRDAPGRHASRHRAVQTEPCHDRSDLLVGRTGAGRCRRRCCAWST